MSEFASPPIFDLEASHLVFLFVGAALGGAFVATFLEEFVDRASHEGSVNHLKAGALGALAGGCATMLLPMVLLLSVLIGYLPAQLILAFIPWVPRTASTIIVLATAIGLYPAFQIIRAV